MDIFGIGPLEFLAIIVVILLVAGPKDIGRGARALGRGLNRLYRSSNYQTIRRISEEIRNLPARLAEEAQLDELKQAVELKEELNELKEAEREVREAARGISELNKQEMQAWVEDLDQPAAKPPPPKPATKPVAPPPAKPAAEVNPDNTNTIGTPPPAAPAPANGSTAAPDAPAPGPEVTKGEEPTP